MEERNIHSRGLLRWYHIAGIVTVLGLLAAILLRFFNNYPSVADIYRPATAHIERMERKEVRDGKRWRWLDFYHATYPAYAVRFPTSFATDTGVYRVGDTVWVLYNPEQPEMNLVYAPRSRAVHLPSGVSLQDVSIDYEEIVRLFDSLEIEGSR